MPTLTETIDDLRATLATAMAVSSAAPEAAALQAAYAERDAILRDMEKTLIRVQAEALALDDIDAGARQAAQTYFDDIAGIRGLLSAAGGLAEVVDNEKAALRSALGEAPDAADSAWLTPLRAAIPAVDAAITTPVTTAEADLATADGEYEFARETFTSQTQAMAAGRLQIANHAAHAAATAQDVYEHLEAARKARDAGNLAAAVVAFDAALSTLASLTDPVDIGADTVAFDADNSSSAALDSAIRDEWSPVKGSYQDALATLIEKETARLEARLALANARIASIQEQASRDVDAAAAVQAVLDS